MRTRLKEVQGINWFDGAVMNCRWEGPLVRDVLLRAGVVDAVRCWRESKGRRIGGEWGKGEEEEVAGRGGGEEGGGSVLYEGLYIQFACYLVPTEDDGWYGGSIDLARAMDPEMEVILALKVRHAFIAPPVHASTHIHTHTLSPPSTYPSLSVCLSVRFTSYIQISPRLPHIPLILFLSPPPPPKPKIQNKRETSNPTQMNDLPLPLPHGGPIRALVPGVLGARSVKWLDSLTVSEHESPNHYQRRDYKVLPPEVVDAESADRYWAVVEAMGEMPINSAVGVPGEGEVVDLGVDARGRGVEDGQNGAGMDLLETRGWATPGGSGGPVTRVEVSGDDGRTWVRAELVGDQDQDRYQDRDGRAAAAGARTSSPRGKWTWVLWHCWLPLERTRTKTSKAGTGEEDEDYETRTILSRAFDAAGNEQPRRSCWNLRGVGYNGFGEVGGVRVRVGRVNE
jgi:Mo-co oxidoreductase dimerisation domain/Oxidoreductase molybdopterin binding domain